MQLIQWPSGVLGIHYTKFDIMMSIEEPMPLVKVTTETPPKQMADNPKYG